ncbi:hypothetical protein GCM10022393_28640 [Aquimarina addita]|uniref:Uncharacterized protein n=1 Tax=Aquimarina addita TaxID=870485 RepID=A0ABP6UMI7_9FLAO
MFTSIITSKTYWKSVFLIAVGFIIIFSIVEHFLQYRGLEFDTFVAEKIDNGRWIRYAISRIVGGFLYGTIMAYYFELRKRKAKQ